MTLFTKTLLILFLLINIGCVTCGDKGQSSGTKDEESNIEDKELKVNLYMELFTAFKHEDSFDNFGEGLLNINGHSFIGVKSYSSTIQCYYYDLFITLQKLNLPRLMSPKKFCYTHHSKNAQKCINVIKDAGCNVDDYGNPCVEHLYLHWKLRDAKKRGESIPGTENLSDEELLQEILSGYQNPYSIVDRDFLEEYYVIQGHTQTSEEEIINHYHLYLIRGGSAYDLKTFRSMILLADRQNFLENFRGKELLQEDAFYINLFREYLRRENLKRGVYYDNSYANFLIDEIKKEDCSAFKNRTEYCKEYLKMTR